MADGTKAGGDAPRTLFSLGRSGKRKGRSTEASPLEDYPPRHAEEGSADTDVALLDPEEMPASELSDGSDGSADAPESETMEDTATPEPCPSCSLPLVAGAMFCGECGTRVTTSEEAAPTGVLLDDAVPGEPLPPDAEGSFEVAEPVTGTFEDDENLDGDDLLDDDGHEIGESTVFGAFIGAELADDDTEPEAELLEEDPEAELVEEDPEAELVEEDPEAELVEEDPAAELVEEDPAAELVEDDAEAELVEDDPEAELVETDAETDTDDDDGAVVPLVAGAAGGAVVGAMASADSADAATLVSSSAAAAGGGSGGGSKKGVWIGAAAAAAAVVLIVGVVAMGGGGENAGKKNDQVAAVSEKSTTTTAGSSTTESTTTTEAPTTTVDPATTETTTPASTVTTQGQTTTTAAPQPPVPPTTVPASKANVQVTCPPTLQAGNSYPMVLKNVGGTQTSFLVTWSALKTGVNVSPTTGTVGANSSTNVNVVVAPGTPGSGSRVTIKWTGGSTSCNLVVQ